ncbi:muA [Reptilian orthoreovirus]|uniref:MuA n=1 Tax=chelonian orthoreovirus TaxID=3071237 RepID=A0A1D7PVG5_9REOV|nr:muA [Reptilian orthoreovirus]AOM63688.1 muA [chelonian orthoreovirus]
MSYLALPIPTSEHTVDTVKRVIATILNIPDKDIFSDCFILDQEYAIRQLSSTIEGIDPQEMIRALLKRLWQHQCVVKLLPSKRRIVEVWRNNRHLAPTSAPAAIFGPLKSERYLRAYRNLRIEDHYQPLYREGVPFSTLVKWENNIATVYSLTPDIVGAPLQLMFPAKYYDIAEDVLKELQVRRHNQKFLDQPRVRVLIGTIPSAAQGNCVVLENVQWNTITATPILLEIMSNYHALYANTSREVSIPVAQAMLSGVKRLGLRVAAQEARAAKAIGISTRVRVTPRHINTMLINVCDVLVTCWRSYTNSYLDAPIGLTFRAVPTSILTLMNLVPSEEVLPLRDEKGMFVQWFMALALFSDKVVRTRSKDNYVINPATGPDVLNFIRVDNVVKFCCQRLDLQREGRLTSIGLCMPKGSFKTTMLSILGEINVASTQVIFSNTVVDSDDVGDSLDPTFEQQLLTAVAGAFGCTEDRVSSALCGDKDVLDLNIMASVMYPIFLDLVSSVLRPQAQKHYVTVTEDMRSLTFAHADSELLDAGWNGRLYRGHIVFDDELNVLMRDSRVGGRWFQLALSRCYKMYASPASTYPVSILLKSLVVPWLDSRDVLAQEDRELNTRVLAWYIPPQILENNGWCSCSEHSHVTYSFIRGHSEDLKLLDLKDWRRFRVKIVVEPKVIGVTKDRRMIRATVHWMTEPVPMEMFEHRALMTPFQKYHMTMSCDCPLVGRQFTYKVGLTLAHAGARRVEQVMQVVDDEEGASGQV